MLCTMGPPCAKNAHREGKASMRAQHLGLAIAAVVVMLSPAIAVEGPSSPAGRYSLTDSLKGGSERKGTLSIEPIEDTSSFDVRATEKWANGTEIAWTGSASMTGPKTLTIRRPLDLATRGLTGV